VTLTELSPLAWALLAVGAMIVGFAKTAVGSAGALAVVAFAAVLPARESTGALLPLLCVGDVVAMRVYHRHANWRLLARMLPGVLPGLFLGAWFVSSVDDTLMRRSMVQSCSSCAPCRSGCVVRLPSATTKAEAADRTRTSR
jgi:uncharacterized membrane protein YfcA